MKTIGFIIILLPVCVLFSCNTEPKIADTNLMTLFDISDRVNNLPSAIDLLMPFDLKNNPHQGIRFEASTINDRDYNNTTVLTLPKEDAWQSNSAIRKIAIQNFTTQLQSCINKIGQTDTTSYSVIFRTVVDHASKLAASKSKKKILLVYSNLYENSDINFYKAETQQQLHDSPKALIERLDKEAKIPSLKNIEIWLIYTPSSYKDNNHYSPIAKLYKAILEVHGAVVHIDTEFQP